MDRLSLKLVLAIAVLFEVAATPSNAQQFEYTPYRGANNTGQPTDPPPDNYTPSHQGAPSAGAASGGAAAPAYQGGARQNAGPADDRSGDAYAPPGGGAYAPPGGSYSPSEDVYSPARPGREALPPPASVPPRGVGGPPPSDFAGNPPRVEAQAAAPGGGIPYSVLEHDARRAAIQGWSSKVADHYGPQFSQWRAAANKRVDCRPDRRDGIVCTASAQPLRGYDRDGSGPRDDGD
jgi:hypothetical protein